LGGFLARPIYLKLCQGTTTIHDKDVWKTKLPLKIKIFVWQMVQNKVVPLVSKYGFGTDLLMAYVLCVENMRMPTTFSSSAN
jgi:hypothetical protein